MTVQCIDHILSYTPRTLLFATALFAFSFYAEADTLTLKDGDTYSGALVGAKTGTLSFRTKLVGKIVVPLDEVHALSTTNLVVVAMEDGRRLPGRLRSRDGSIFVVGRGGEETWRKVNMAELRTITTLAASAPVNAPPRRPPAEIDTRASVSPGYVWRSGEESFSGPVLGIELEVSGKRGSLKARAQAEYVGDEARTDRFASAEVRARATTRRKWSPELILEIERNRNKALELRTDFTAAIAASLFQDENQSLQMSAGVGVAFEDYDAEPLRRDGGGFAVRRPGESPQRDDDLNLNLRLEYRRELYRGAYIEEILSFRPSMSDFGKVRSRWESSLYLPVTKSMELKLKFELDYDNSLPYKDVDELRSGVELGIKVSF